MDPTVDLFCARLVVTSLYVTPEQVREGFEIQRAMRRGGGTAEPLAEVLLAKGYLDLEQAQEVRDAVAAAQAEGRLTGEAGTEAEAAATRGAGVPPGLEIPGVTLTARTGTSLTGVDFDGRHEATGADAVVHVLFPRYAREADARDRFLTAADGWQLVNHANVAPLLDAGEAGARVYAVHRRPPGRPLRAVLASGRCDAAAVTALGRHVAEALAAAHAVGSVAGALRPEEIYVAGADAVQVRFCPRPETGADVRTAGEAAYLPPEWDPDAPPTPAGDLYALGVILMESLCGRLPLTIAEDASPDDVCARSAEGLPRTRDLRGDVPAPLATLVDWLTATDARARPETADQAVAAFGMLSMGLEPAVGADVRGAPVKRPTTTRRPRPRASGPATPPDRAPRAPASRPATSRAPAPRGLQRSASPRSPAGRPGPRPGPRSGPRGGPRAGGPGPWLWIGLGGGALLLLLLVVGAMSLGSGSARERGRSGGHRMVAKREPSPPVKGFEPTTARTTAPAPPRTVTPPDPPTPATTTPADPDVAAGRESEARDFLARARAAMGRGEYVSAFKLWDYLEKTYGDTRTVAQNRDEIALQKAEAKAKGQIADDPGAPSGAPKDAFLVVDGDIGDWTSDWSEGDRGVFTLQRVVATAKAGKGIDGHSAFVAPEYDLTDCTIEADVNVHGDPRAGGIGLTFRFDRTRPSLYEFAVRAGVAIFYHATAAGVRELARATVGVPAEGRFRIGVIVRGDTFEGYINGTAVLTARDTQVPRGLIGFGKYGGSSAEFSDIRVERSAMPISKAPAPAAGGPPGPVPGPVPGPPIDPLPTPAAGATPAPGTWKGADGGSWAWVAPGVAQGSGEGLGSYGHAAWLDTDSGGRDFTAQVSVKLLPSADGAFAGLAIRSDGSRTGIEFYLYTVDGNTGWRLARFENEKWSKIETGALRVDLTVWYKLKVQVEGSTLRCWIDGQQVYEGTVPLPADGACALVKYGKTSAQWRNIRFPVK